MSENEAGPSKKAKVLKKDTQKPAVSKAVSSTCFILRLFFLCSILKLSPVLLEFTFSSDDFFR